MPAVSSVQGVVTFEDGTRQEFTVSYTPTEGLHWDSPKVVAEGAAVLDALTVAVARLRSEAGTINDPTPPDEVLNRAPTVADVRRWPEHYISGPGRAVASKTHCPHRYYLTDSCPGCDADEEAERTAAEI
jgi:hypothetical protein